jgi:SAM-dependent methyltransferase
MRGPASLSRIKRQWEALGREDPLWGVLSDPAKRGNRWDVEEFFRTGPAELASILTFVECTGTPLRRGSALDFGCGVGRLSQALAEQFREVHGVDVAESMIAGAKSHNRHGERCAYHVNTEDRLPFEAGRFDFVLSVITLQHMPARLASSYITEFVRVLAPGGVAYFQIPAAPVELSRVGGVWPRIRRMIRHVVPEPVRAVMRSVSLAMSRSRTFEMHGLPRVDVEALLGRAGARLVAVAPDASAGAGWTSFRYVAAR